MPTCAMCSEACDSLDENDECGQCAMLRDYECRVADGEHIPGLYFCNTCGARLDEEEATGGECSDCGL